jgi:hypothetical protein
MWYVVAPLVLDAKGGDIFFPASANFGQEQKEFGGQECDERCLHRASKDVVCDLVVLDWGGHVVSWAFVLFTFAC